MKLTSMTTATLLAAGLGLLVATQPSNAATLLDDHFDNGVLGTDVNGINGGFTAANNGAGTAGSVTESDSLAKIVDGTGNNTIGIVSNNAFDLSDTSLSYTATWQVANVNFFTPTSNTNTRERVLFGLQSNSGWLLANSGGDASRLYVDIDAPLNRAVVAYQNRSGGTNAATLFSPSFDLGAFFGDIDGFSATLNFDATGYTFTTIGLNATNQPNISGTWAALGTSFAEIFGTDGDMRVSAYIQDGNTDGALLDIDRITLTAIPEPSSLALLGLGGLLIARRRRG